MKINVNNMTTATQIAAFNDILTVLRASCDSFEWLAELTNDANALLASIKEDMEPATDAQHTQWLKLVRNFQDAMNTATDTACIAELDNLEIR